MSTTEHSRQLADETADVLGQVLLFAHQHDLDLGAAIQRKWRFDPEHEEPKRIAEEASRHQRARPQLAVQVGARVGEEELRALFLASWPERSVASYAAVLAKSLTWVTARSEQLVGFVNVASDGGVHAFLLDTTVHPSVQRLGIGQDLVAAAASAAKARGMQWLHVDHAQELVPFYRSCDSRRRAPA